MNPRLRALPDDLRELYEERAAIMEHDGGLSRKDAENAALDYCLREQVRRKAGSLFRGCDEQRPAPPPEPKQGDLFV